MSDDYDCWYQYVMVRKDMPFHYHIIQTAHAVQEATIKFGGPTVEQPIHLILLEAKDEIKLMDAQEEIGKFGIKQIAFHEPDYQTGYTAVACELLKRDDPRREFMKQFRMYK